ncbi:hypothetical protein MKEN_01279100 [Mycena kentingensis (nom. inval.)]|nr:hypothetical protein MKEN_01279100 [Mycena kentingensis (nom. inval.)]
MAALIFALPNELIIEIFLRCLPHSPNRKYYPWPRAAPLLLTYVCRHWKLLALASPELWSSVEKQFAGAALPESTTPSDRLLELCLQRAQSRQIRLSVLWIPPQSLCDLMQRFPTITHLRVGYGHREITPHLEIVSSRFAGLETLEVWNGNIFEWITAPALRELLCEREFSPKLIARMVMRSGCSRTLTTLQLRAPGMRSALVDLLRLLPAVVSLQIHEPRISEPASLRRIRYLPSVVHALQDEDVVPRLSELDLSSCFVPSSYAALTEILTRRRTKLCKVKLHLQWGMQIMEARMDPTTGARLAEMQRDGLDLFITSSSW